MELIGEPLPADISMIEFANSAYIPHLGAHRAEYIFLDVRTPVFVIGPSDLSLEEVARRREKGFAWVMTRLGEIKEFAAGELVALKNESWREEGQTEDVTPGEFCARMLLRAVRIAEDGTVEVMFTDGGLFWGHEIVVRADASGTMLEADLEG